MSTRCYCCHEPTDINSLDAKPTPTLWLALIELFRGQASMLRYAADRGYDFDHLECRACYGSEWEPGP
jgi:hypothetical protein